MKDSRRIQFEIAEERTLKMLAIMDSTPFPPLEYGRL